MMFSIIIPVFNGEKTIERCLDSVFSQSFHDYEVVCINDGSIDNTGFLIEKYRERYQNLVYINKENGGIAEARNTGLDNASGEYIYFMDADDWIENTLLSDVVDVIAKEADLDIILFNAYKNINNLDIPLKIITPSQGGLKNKDRIETFAIYYKNAVVWNKIIKKNLIDKTGIRFIDLFYLDDFVFCIQIYQAARSVYHLSKYEYHYVENLSSITHQHDNRVIKMWRDYYERAKTFLPISSERDYFRYLNSHVMDGLGQIFCRYISCNFNGLQKRREFYRLRGESPYATALRNYDRKYLSNMSKVMMMFGRPTYLGMQMAIILKRMRGFYEMIRFRGLIRTHED